MKYRIKEKDGKFYPQKKVIFWTCFPGEPYHYQIPYPTFFALDYGIGYNDLFFNTLDEARRYVEFYKNEKKVTYHEI